MDEMFDVLGLSVFFLDEKWCLREGMPCIPMPSCDEDTFDGHCKYEFKEDETR